MAKLETLIDSFDGTTLDTTKWKTPPVNPGYVTLGGGTLNIVTPAGIAAGSAACEVDSNVNTWSFTESYLFAKVSLSAAATQQFSMIISSFLAGSDSFKMLKYGNSITITLYNGTTNLINGSVTYDPVTMAWWRIRHTSGVVYFETSPNGTVWTIQASNPYVPKEAGYGCHFESIWTSVTTASTINIDNANYIAPTFTDTHPLKAWTDGELFHGDDLDRLFINSTMRFASTASRSATLVGDYAPTAGMHTALVDDHLTYKYNGSLWLPPIGTAMFDYVQTSASQNVNNNVWTVVSAYNTNAIGRNWGNWFNPTTGKFTPQLPGLYELSGSAVIYHTTETAGLRQACFRLNGANVVSSICAYTTAMKTGIYVYADCKSTAVAFNGTTDYAELACYQNSGSTLGILTPSRFAATYQGA